MQRLACPPGWQMLVVQGRGPTMPGRTEATAAGGVSTRYPRRQLFALPASLDQVQMRACAPRPSPGDILFAPPPRLNRFAHSSRHGRRRSRDCSNTPCRVMPPSSCRNVKCAPAP